MTAQKKKFGGWAEKSEVSAGGNMIYSEEADKINTSGPDGLNGAIYKGMTSTQSNLKVIASMLLDSFGDAEQIAQCEKNCLAIKRRMVDLFEIMAAEKRAEGVPENENLTSFDFIMAISMVLDGLYQATCNVIDGSVEKSEYETSTRKEDLN